MKEKKEFDFVHSWTKVNRDQKMLQQRKKRFFVLLAGVGMILLLSVPWLIGLYLDKELDKVSNDLHALREVQEVTEQKERHLGQIDKIERLINLVEEKTLQPSKELAKITNLLPAGTVVNAYSLRADRTIQITITLPGPISVADLWTRFRDSGLFEGFDLGTVSLRDNPQRLNLNLKMKQ